MVLVVLVALVLVLVAALVVVLVVALVLVVRGCAGGGAGGGNHKKQTNQKKRARAMAQGEALGILEGTRVLAMNGTGSSSSSTCLSTTP